MNRSAPTFKKLEAEHCREIEDAIEKGKAKRKLPNDVSISAILAELNNAYVRFQIAKFLDPTITAEHRDRWTRISNLFSQLANEFDEAKEDWFFPRPPITEPVSDIRNMKAKDAASYAQELRDMEETSRRHANSLSAAITGRRGGARRLATRSTR